VTSLSGLQLLQRRDRAYADDLLIAAVAELDLFTWLRTARLDSARELDERSGATFDQLCHELGLARRPARVLVVLAASLGLIERDGATLRCSESARRHLVAGAEQDLRPYFASLRDRPAVAELVTVLRTGEPAAWASGGDGADWATAMTDPATAVRLTASMDARASVLAPALAAALDHLEVRHVLDVAGGSGAYAAALVERRPGLRATVLEQPQVAAAARTLLAARGLADRIDVAAQDAFAGAWPQGCDLHLFSHVLHDWDETRIELLLRSSYDALPSGGYVVDHDAHLDRDENGPLDVAEYSVLLCHSTYGRCYSIAEIEALLIRTGFEAVRIVPTTAHRTVVIGRRP
jgi:SAM-dependent methyltransferase